jgi:hypothetical protein
MSDLQLIRVLLQYYSLIFNLAERTQIPAAYVQRVCRGIRGAPLTILVTGMAGLIGWKKAYE